MIIERGFYTGSGTVDLSLFMNHIQEAGWTMYPDMQFCIDRQLKESELYPYIRKYQY